MNVISVKTDIIKPGYKLTEVIDKHLPDIAEKTIVAVTSKVVSVCEGQVVPIGNVDKEELIRRESDYFLDPSLSKYGLSFTITKGTLVPIAGIDESNGNGSYILWPKDPQKSANSLRQYLRKRLNLADIGVVITDSTARPLHFGTEGVAIAYSGFEPSNNYIGQPDLFGRVYKVSVSNIADALASAAVVVMGEGAEQTPLTVINSVPFVRFRDRDPTREELKGFYLSHMEDDLFAPFLKNAPWQKGERE